jgi:hypothetical protein
MSQQKLKGSELADCIAQLMTECAEEQGCDARELDWKPFQKFLKEQDLGVTSVEVGKAGGFKVIRDAYFPPLPTQSTIEISHVKDHARLNRKLGAQAVREQFMAENIEDFADRVFRGRIEPFSISRLTSGNKKTGRIVNAVLSDLHFGADLRAEETGLAYGKVEEARQPFLNRSWNTRSSTDPKPSLNLFSLGTSFKDSFMTHEMGPNWRSKFAGLFISSRKGLVTLQAAIKRSESAALQVITVEIRLGTSIARLIKSGTRMKPLFIIRSARLARRSRTSSSSSQKPPS